MKTIAARLLTLLAAILFSSACRHAPRGGETQAPAGATTAPSAPLSPSPRLIVGRILSVDREQRFALVDLQADAPAPALQNGAELSARDYAQLTPTGTLRASRYVRGRTLGTTIVSGQPSPGDEVVWLAP